MSQPAFHMDHMLFFFDSLRQRGAHVAPYTDESFEARSVSERRRALRSAKACLASQHQAQQRSSALLRERMAALDDELAALDGGENDDIENHPIGEEGGADARDPMVVWPVSPLQLFPFLL